MVLGLTVNWGDICVQVAMAMWSRISCVSLSVKPQSLDRERYFSSSPATQHNHHVLTKPIVAALARLVPLGTPMLRSRTIPAFVILGALAFTSCKHEVIEPTPVAGTFRVYYGFHWDGASDLDLDSTYADVSGHAIRFTEVKFFMGAVHLENAGVEVARYEHRYALCSPDADPSMAYGDLPAGDHDVDVVRLTLGLDSADNHGDPATAQPPLNDTAMHWGTSTANGYYFMVLEGRVDDDGTGVVDTDDPSFSYRCATDAALRVAELPYTAPVVMGRDFGLHIHVHICSVLAGVDVLATPSATGYEAANQVLMDNMVTAVEAE